MSALPRDAWLSAAADIPPEVFQALADPVRRRLLERLVAGAATPRELARWLSLGRANVGHHLGVLAAAGLVSRSPRRASANPEAVALLRGYFDLALIAAAIGLPRPSNVASNERIDK